jgi:hypothetical protein
MKQDLRRLKNAVLRETVSPQFKLKDANHGLVDVRTRTLPIRLEDLLDGQNATTS